MEQLDTFTDVFVFAILHWKQVCFLLLQIDFASQSRNPHFKAEPPLH